MNRVPKFFLPLACFVVIVAGLKAAGTLILPFLLALFLAILTLPLLAWLRQRMPDGLAVCLTVLAAVALIVGAGVRISESLSGFIASTPKYQDRLKVVVADLDVWLESMGLPTGQELGLEQVAPSSALDLAVGTLRGLAAAVTSLVLVFVTLIFLLLERAGEVHQNTMGPDQSGH